MVPDGIGRIIGSLGERVGTYPVAFGISSLLLALLFSTGLQRIQYITDNEILFVPHNAPGLKEREIGKLYDKRLLVYYQSQSYVSKEMVCFTILKIKKNPKFLNGYILKYLKNPLTF